MSNPASASSTDPKREFQLAIQKKLNAFGYSVDLDKIDVTITETSIMIKAHDITRKRLP